MRILGKSFKKSLKCFFVYRMSAYVCNMPETQITDDIPFNGNSYRFVRTLHGLKAVVDIPVDDAHYCP